MENASLRFSIKTNVDLERDPVLGTKTLKLKEIFADQEDKVRKKKTKRIYMFFFYLFFIQLVQRVSKLDSTCQWYWFR